ncbi:hypothetical protein EIP86_010141 [Pleurotus ostreatoroseus]|nr:hypothetical protein EIP86_010141 [Pleurotus ostreatoroseus]
MTVVDSRDIHEGWTFKKVTAGGASDEYVKVDEEFIAQQFPTTVHVELLKQGKIPDPFIGLHEWDVQWIGETDWTFSTLFDATEEELRSPNVDLVCDGLDTFATVTLNGKELMKTNNQFVSYRVPVKGTLQKENNSLIIAFESAFRKGRQTEKDNGGKLLLWNGDSSRLHVRKAQYNYGWDWGPVLMTVGPWKPIRLESYSTRIAEVDVRTTVSESMDASISVSFNITESNPVVASVQIYNKDGKLVIGQSNMKLVDKAHADFGLWKGAFEPWYPVGYGKQPIYTAQVTIADEQGQALDTKTQKFGIRRAVVVEDRLEDQPGRTFLFEINNVRVFCGGQLYTIVHMFHSNLVLLQVRTGFQPTLSLRRTIKSSKFCGSDPDIMALPSMTRDRYRAWLQLLVDGNQNMIRVWGGGIYEADDFYELCDELGIMVWQDFMFGCGQYPAYDAFVENVKLEAEQNVKRLRHHPSVVIFAGNNEDYQVAESNNLDLDYSDEDSDFRKTNFPARYIYERVLPEIVSAHSNIHYHRSSPYSGFGKKTTDKTYGDLHQWNVWHGSQEPWHNWDILAGRFVSEFGMEAYPNIRTVDHWLGGNKAERFPQSRIMNNHNKADGFERRLELYLMENFRHAFDMESYVYYTQIMQAETLGSAYRLWRRNWKGRGREYTAGALVWQLSPVPTFAACAAQINDCWPVTSWAIVDYFLRPKPAYFAIKRELRPYTVGMTRKERKTSPDPLSAGTFTLETVLEVWATNSTLEAKEAWLEVTGFDLGDPEVRDVFVSERVELRPNASTELWAGAIPGQPVRTKQSEVPRPLVVSARLLEGEKGPVLARYSNWPEPFKYLTFPAVDQLGLQIRVGPDGESVTLSTERPIKGIVLDIDVEGPSAPASASAAAAAADDAEVQWGDQAIDLVPGDVQVIRAVGLQGRKVAARFLGDGTA